MQRLKCLMNWHDWRRIMPINAKNTPGWRCAGCRKFVSD